MRLSSHSFVVAAVAACLASAGAARRAAAQSGDAMGDGFIAGDYLRLGAGYVSPVNPQGGLKEWKPGIGFNASWENWQPSQTGTSRVGFGLGASYAMLPLDEQHFIHDFAPSTGGTATAATASHAGILQITTGLRVRIPAPYITPTINFNFGFINWAPGKINYTSSNGTSGTAQQQHRSGAEFAIGGGLDKTVYDRWAIFGEAMYTYGFTSYGQFAAPSGTCLANTCDLLKNTTLGTVRGGVRVRTGR
jgi:hypothetical protein